MGNKKLIQAMKDVKESINSYTMTAASILIGAAALEDEDYFQEKLAMVMATRSRVKEELEHRGFAVLDSRANFLFAKKEGVSGTELFEKLRDKKIFVRHFNGERIKDYLRITIGTPEQMQRFFEELDLILG